jgi:DNA-binding LacI/PurR family transcriptional regulator
MNGGSASPKMRERVQRAADRAGYVPDQRARLLKTNKSLTIGVIIPDIANPVYPLQVQVIHDILKSRGYRLFLGCTYGEVAEESTQLEMMRRERVAGVIVATCEGEDDSVLAETFRSLRKQEVPCVLIGKTNMEGSFDVVTVDNVTGSRRATDYLLRTGRRRLAVLTGPRGVRATEERLKGVYQAAADHGLEPADILLRFTDAFTSESGRQAAGGLLESSVDGLICGNDLLAIGTLQAARALSLSVPDQVAVVGFDDIPPASWVTPRLTTVSQPFEEVARKACDLLLGRMEKRLDHEPGEHLLEPSLIVRESA